MNPNPLRNGLGAYRKRPELNQILDLLRVEDIITVWELERSARSTRNLLDIAETISLAGAGSNPSQNRGPVPPPTPVR